jgi:hypothetical protein
MGDKSLQVRTHAGNVPIRDSHVLRQIADCRWRIAGGWEALKDRKGEKSEALFSLIGLGLLTQIGWVDQAFKILIALDDARDEAQWRPLVEGLEQRTAWRAMRDDAAHFIDRTFTVHPRANNPEAGDAVWRVIDPDFASGTICTGDASINVPELLATVDDFLIRARPLVIQDRALAEPRVAGLQNLRANRPWQRV